MKLNQGSKYKSGRERSMKLSHSDRYGNDKDIQYQHGNVNVDLSKYNMYYNPTKNVHQKLVEQFKPYVDAHNDKMKAQHRPSRMYGNSRKHLSPVDDYLSSRWLRPIRTTPLRMCDEDEKDKLNKIYKDNGFTKKDEADDINKGYKSFVDNWNKNNPYLPITSCHTNLYDEKGGFHGHIDYLALGRTKKGKPSLSFNNALKISLSNYKGNDPCYKHPVSLNYHKASSKFVAIQQKQLQHFITKRMQDRGLNINLVERHRSRNSNSYINDLGAWQKSQDEKKSLRQLLRSALKQNAKLKAEAKIQKKIYQKLEKEYWKLSKRYAKLLELLKLIVRKL